MARNCHHARLLARLAIAGDVQRVTSATGRRELRLQVGTEADLVMRPIVDFLELAFGQPQRIEIAHMQARARRFAGRQRDHTASADFPFTVIMVDEIAFLTAYQADRKLKDRILAALATLTTQGRAVGYCVVAAVLTPPDPISQTSLALPTIALYEISIIAVRFVEKARREAEAK